MRTLILTEMANIPITKTGLPFVGWIDTQGSDRNVEHNLPRIKVKINGDYVPVSISKKPKPLVKGMLKNDIPDYRLFKKWMNLNYDLLMKQWNGLIDDIELKSLLKKI